MKKNLKTIAYAFISYNLLFSSVVYANTNSSPKFSHYSTKLYTANNAKVQLNEHTYSFRTRFRNLSKTPVNFAGQYAITFVGCGASCVFGLMYNAKSGKTAFLPSVTGCFKEDGFYDSEKYYKENSRLLIMAGSVNEEECSSNYYVVQPNGTLKLIKKMPFPID